LDGCAATVAQALPLGFLVAVGACIVGDHEATKAPSGEVVAQPLACGLTPQASAAHALAATQRVHKNRLLGAAVALTKPLAKAGALNCGPPPKPLTSQVYPCWHQLIHSELVTLKGLQPA
jgi:hypothetical protein